MTQFSLPLSQNQIQFFQNTLLTWFDVHGRHDLPWQQNKTPYRVWVSEIMLQQTQVKTVIPYYQRFMESFPTLTDLANADQDEVLSHWSGLGYYSRARNLHKAAKIAQQDHDGDLPKTLDEMMQLPGIGRSTAGAILAISRKQPTPIQDGNVRRVLSRLFAIDGDLSKADKQRQLWQIATELTPIKRVDDYTQAIMDLGATLCTRTKAECSHCPFMNDCQAHVQDRVAELPNKKAKKQTPLREARFLFWFDGDELFMEQRPQSGIWGGLWVPPSFDSDSALTNYLISEGVSADLEQLDAYRHVFSHYKLDIIPIFMTAKRTQRIAEGNQRWQTAQAWLKAGLPAPIKQLLQDISTRVNR